MFRRIFLAFLISVFGLFLMSPVFATGDTDSTIVFLGSRSGNICSTNITCEKATEGIYNCSSAPETIASAGTTIHQISTGKESSGNIFSESLVRKNDECFETDSKIRFPQRVSYVYPFVRIIKIQV